MKYYEVNFSISCPESLFGDVCDVLSALAGEAGFETFEETPTGLKGYVQQSVFDDNVLKGQLAFMPFDDTTVNYTVAEAADKDWNEQWEQEGFAPIVVGDRCVVHDGRHLDGVCLSHYGIAIEIDAHLAFGTGTHETTRLMLDALLSLPLQGLRVLDCGCGTGILGIAALKAGAAQAVGYDIDEWSADNARHNAIINGVDNQYTALLGDARVAESLNEQFHVVLANINRNILLSDLPVFRSRMLSEGKLLLSGFYLSDAPQLVETARQQGLSLQAQSADGEWACLQFVTL